MKSLSKLTWRLVTSMAFGFLLGALAWGVAVAVFGAEAETARAWLDIGSMIGTVAAFVR